MIMWEERGQTSIWSRIDKGNEQVAGMEEKNGFKSEDGKNINVRGKKS